MATLLDLYRGNEEYIGEVIQASRNILRVVVDGLLPDDYLKHTPVRTYFRVLSAAMFLLKVHQTPICKKTDSLLTIFPDIRPRRQRRRRRRLPKPHGPDHQRPA